MNARKTTVQNQRVTVSFQRAPATTDVVVHKARKLGASRGARGALWAHASSVHNRVNALRSSARDGRTKNHCAESTSYSEFPESVNAARKGARATIRYACVFMQWCTQ